MTYLDDAYQSLSGDAPPAAAASTDSTAAWLGRKAGALLMAPINAGAAALTYTASTAREFATGKSDVQRGVEARAAAEAAAAADAAAKEKSRKNTTLLIAAAVAVGGYFYFKGR
jgi:hypothetical protein